MAAKEGDTKQLLRRSLLLVFKEKPSHQQSSSPSSGGVGKDQNTPPPPTTGQDLYDQWIQRNKDCHWNPHLEESFRNLKFVGYLVPHTLIVGGRDIYLDTVRNAWSRRSLRAPHSLTLHRVGELSGLSMTPCAQTQFTPLPEAVCLIIHELRQSNMAATLHAIDTRLREMYRGMQQPHEQLIYEALDRLMQERKIYHTGLGYGIVSPDMFQNPPIMHHPLLGGPLNHPGCGLTLHDNLHPALYLPYPHNNPGVSAEMRSISCQTSNQPKLQEEPEVELPMKKKPLERSLSLRDSKKNKEKNKMEASNFSRSQSMRFSDDRHAVKDINLKTSDMHQDKDKGDKQSLLSKLFGRGKSHHGKQRTSSTNEEGSSTLPNNSPKSGAEEKEYATFSAQFPPPDWQIMEQQIQIQNALQQSGLPTNRASTWQPVKSPVLLPNSDPLNDSYECPMHTCKTLPPHFAGFLQDSMKCTLQKRSSSSRSSSRSSSYQEIPGSGSKKPDMVDTPMSHVKPRSKSSRKHSSRRMNREQKVSEHRHSRHLQDDVDVRPKIPSGGKYDSLPRSPDIAENTYLDLNEAAGPLREGPLREGPLREGPLREEEEDKAQDESPTSAPVENPFGPKHRHHRSNQKSRIFKKYREMYCASFPNDTTAEYIGALPQKNGAYSMSRDSGVNCVGIGNQPNQPDHPVSNQSGGNSNSGTRYNRIPTNTPLVLTQTGIKPKEQEPKTGLVEVGPNQTRLQEPKLEPKNQPAPNQPGLKNQPESAVKVIHHVTKTVQKNTSTPMNNNHQQRQQLPLPKQQQHQQQHHQVLELNNLRFVQTTFHNDNANSVTTVHKAQIHGIPEAPMHEDSGFNSPRMEASDSINTSTPQHSQRTPETIEHQNNLTKNQAEPQVVPSSVKITNEEFSKSIDNLHGGGDSDHSFMWSSSSQQTVKEVRDSKPVPYLPPPREWRPSSRDQTSEPRDVSAAATSGLKTEQKENGNHEAKDFKQPQRNGVSTRFSVSMSLKESFFNGDVKPKTQNNNYKDASSVVDTKKNIPVKKDEVKKNLGEEIEAVKEQGTRLHERVFQEYHNNSSHHQSKTSLSGTMRKGDFEVVGVI